MDPETRLRYERNVFMEVLAQDTPSAKAHKLDELCHGQPDLKNRILVLLRSYDQAATILSHPAPVWLKPLVSSVNSSALSGDEDSQSINSASDATVHLASQGNALEGSQWPAILDRYEIEGEIARGGMGAILKGRDIYLGRDLAIKVLLDCHRNRPEIVHRFIEEGQIGGQLQHPGIAPVFELGIFSDGRPFISMKLVKGETLSTLLAARAAPNDELDKFIGIYEQICQTMAYVHQRGVIHRDLKPSNVMVGAFREVQVMDWGLAKVLAGKGLTQETTVQERQPTSVIRTVRSGSDAPVDSALDIAAQTRAGSVLGTIAYMPPEQALGYIEQLDERADVFALGAILCEILTGQPPYVRSDTTNIHVLAVRGQLEECLKRLDDCGADKDLIQLTRDCLAVQIGDRPRDAGQVAQRVTEYLEAVRTKLRDAELQLATEEARAIEQRKRRRLSTILTATLLGFVAISLFVWREVSKNMEAVRSRAAAIGLIDTLLKTDIRQVRAAVDAIEPLRKQLAMELDQQWTLAEVGSSDKLRLSLATLTPTSRNTQLYLFDQLPYLTFDEFEVVREYFRKHSIRPSPEAIADYWELAMDVETPSSTVFQTGCVLSTHSSDDKRWSQLASKLVSLLVNDDSTVPALQLPQRIQQLEGVISSIEPHLQSILSTGEATEFSRQRAATCLASLLSKSPGRLVETLLACRRQSEFAPLLGAMDTQVDAAKAELQKVYASLSDMPRSQAQPLVGEHQLCIAAIAIAHLGQSEPVVELLSSPDIPVVSEVAFRSLVKHYAHEIPIDLSAVLEQIESDTSLTESTQRELFDLLGRWGARNVPKAVIRDVERMLGARAQTTLDPGLHWTAQATLMHLDSPVILERLPALPLSASAAQQVNQLLEQSHTLAAQLDTARADLPERRRAWEQELVQRDPEAYSIGTTSLKFKLSLDGPQPFDLQSSLAGEAKEFAERQLQSSRRVGSIRNLSIEFLGHPPINFGDAVTFHRDQPFSMGAWVYTDPNQPRQWCSILSRMNPSDGNQGVDLWLDGGKIGLHINHHEPESYIKVLTITEQPRQYWHHLLVSYDGQSSAEGVHIYVDGRAVPTQVVSDTLTGSIEANAPLMLGARGDGSFPFRGWIEDIQIHDKELSPKEVNSIYLSTIQLIAKMRKPLKPERKYPLEQAFQDETLMVLQDQQRLVLERLAQVSWTNRRRWFSNSQALDFSILPNEVAVKKEDQQQYDFAIAIHEVTREAFQKSQTAVSDSDLPLNSPPERLTWFDAAAYCNWLSQKEGIAPDQWCFEPNAEGKMATGAKLKPNYLQLSGYRLPTVVEWRAACRYHSGNTYIFSESSELIDDYSWHARNARGQVHPVGWLASNSLGLFDVHGNVAEWTMDIDNLGPDGQILTSSVATLVGGNIASPLTALAIESTTTAAPDQAPVYTGFRLVRSWPRTP